MLQRMALAGLEIIVAGGTGGIGSVVTRALAGEGANVTATYRSNADRANQLAGIANVVQADLAIGTDRARLLASAGQLYGLVVLTGDPARTSREEPLEQTMHRSHDANYLGPILLARESAARMREQNIPGSIVLTATMQAIALFPNSSVYAAQKAALIHAARILAKENRGTTGIRVNVISPGIIAAGMAKASIESGKYNRFTEEHTIERFGRPEDIARGIRLFLEPDNYITGQVLAIDGGITL
ncbi:SDR family NAD(P)-dependent oxidoreductase [Nevskia soli]|uniref:SDR family NAD(P)-dependent oxidoreductase n=1 Tax=Nevskia soli TaxID=418856 RepID=UPI001C5C954D|nr:SDR family oxidoreductase [Nevskia soli]